MVIEKYLTMKRKQLAVISVLRIIYVKQAVTILSFKFRKGQEEFKRRLTGKFMAVVLANGWKRRQNLFGKNITAVLTSKIRHGLTFNQ